MKQVTTTTGNEEDEDVNMMTATGEYIFIIDRSGSMMGERIAMAKEALIVALKSLPPNSYFNIYSFGSWHSLLFPTNMESSEKNVEDAIKLVREFRADMGGTDILEPILKAMTEPRRKKHPRSIFLLTDGAVSNTSTILSTIEEYSHRNRVFALGIGNGCSPALVQGCADRGKGKAAFVKDPKDISGNVISLITAAVVPVCDDFKLEYSDKSMIMMVAPEPSAHKYLLRNERATFYVFLHNEAINQGRYFDVSLSCFDTHKNDYTKNVIKLDLENYESSLDVFKLGIWQVADTLARRESGLSPEIPDVYWAGKTSILEEIVKLSVQNQVLTKKTAFLCIAQENSKDEIGSLKLVKEIVPQVYSADYSSKACKTSSFEVENRTAPQNMMMMGLASGPMVKCGATGFSGNIPDMRYHANRTLESDLDMRYTVNCVSEGVPDMRYKANRDSESIKGIGALRKAESKPLQGAKALKKPAEYVSFSYESDDKKKKQDVTYTSSQTKTGEADSFLEIIQKQKMAGFWVLAPELLKLIKITKEDLLSKIPEPVKNAKGSIENAAITVAVLVWLEKYYQDKKSTWAMIHKKGQQWLGTQGVKYTEVAPLITFV